MNKFSALRKVFIDYQTNPAAFLDFSTLRDRGNGEFILEGKTLEDVTGLQKLGSGMYATAYAIDEKRVLKVLHGKDAGYERFVKKVVKVLGRNNPYIPRIYYDGNWGGKRVFILERLQETEVNVLASLEGYHDDLSWVEIDNLRAKHRKVIRELEKKNSEREALNSMFRKAITSNLRCETGNPFMKLEPQLEKLIELLRDSQSYGDIHSGNVMFRGDVPVLTDPSCGGDETCVETPSDSEDEVIFESTKEETFTWAM